MARSSLSLAVGNRADICNSKGNEQLCGKCRAGMGSRTSLAVLSCLKMGTSSQKQLDTNSSANLERDLIARESTTSGTWELFASWRDHVIGPSAPDWFALESDPRAERVKTGHHRSVVRVKLGDRVLFAKVYDDSANSLLKRIFAKRASEREWRTTIEMQRRGIPVVQPVGFGISSGSKQTSVFLSEEFAGAETLSSFWNRTCRKRGRETENSLIRSVAQLLAHAHERGVMPRDNHPANILVRLGRDDILECRLVDVLGGKLRKSPASETDRATSLAQLDQFFAREATRTMRLRFLHFYLAERGEPTAQTENLRGQIRSFLPQFVIAKQKHTDALVRRRDRRLRGDGKYFARVDLDENWTAIVVLKLARRQVFPEPDVVDRRLEQWMPILRTTIQNAEQIKAAMVRSELKESLAAERLAVSSRSQWAQNNQSRYYRSENDVFHEFEAYHRRRHRDLPAPLWLAALKRQGSSSSLELILTPRELDKVQ